VQFNRDIRPILADKCFACHGPDAGQREADLRLDDRDDAVADRGGYQVVRPGDPDESELLARVTSDDESLRMPPVETGKALSEQDLAHLRRWIAAGAPYESHWSFIPPQRPDLPELADASWARNAIDLFILRQLDEHGLEPAADADPRILLRRLAFDLTGLPPVPEEVTSLAADLSPAAYESAVDRLLSSQHFGERMAVYWLDVVRFADSGGYHSDNHRDVAPYRDYVIRAFNENKPFDQFTLEQIAGDLLPAATIEQKIASGYNRLLQTTEEGGAQPKEYTAKYQADRVRNTAGAWLGLTMGCCECHDHKFDPLTLKDFYSFAAFFADIQEKAVGRQEQVSLPNPPQQRKLADLKKRLEAQREQAKQEDGKEKGDAVAEIEKLEKEIQAMEASLPQTLISVSQTPRTVRILPRGNWQDDSGAIVGPATPEALPAAPVVERQEARSALAQWMVSRDNPLVARVFVNRLWKLFFGEGIVRSLADFGTQGDWPSHPDLLDWLAVELIDSGWDVKHMVKLMVMSRTYQLTSHAPRELRQRDPTNRWLARQNRFRLDAELVRDNALAISGLLCRKVGGRSVKPYQPAGYWQHLNFPKRTWKQEDGDNLYRRGLYTYWQRTFLHPSLAAFDAPSREECTVDRPRSNTPLQALVLLNDPTFVEAARGFAMRILDEGGDTVDERLRFAFHEALNRPPTDQEKHVLSELQKNHLAEYQAETNRAEELLDIGELPAAKDGDTAEMAAWTSVARVILNLHETITRY
jgi:hypothetical protein